MMFTRRPNPLLKYFGKEDNFAASICTYLKCQYPRAFWWHTANEGKRTPLEQLKVVMLGILPGVWDIVIISDLPDQKGLWIELKVPPNKLTDYQRAFGKRILECGFETYVGIDNDATRKAIDTYILTRTTYGTKGKR